jgi:hypothetical protein
MSNYFQSTHELSAHSHCHCQHDLTVTQNETRVNSSQPLSTSYIQALRTNTKLSATNHHIVWISRISWPLNVNCLSNSSQKDCEAANAEDEAHSEVEPEWEAEVIAISHRHEVSPRAIRCKYRNPADVQQTYELTQHSYSYRDKLTVFSNFYFIAVGKLVRVLWHKNITSAISLSLTLVPTPIHTLSMLFTFFALLYCHISACGRPVIPALSLYV